MKRTLVLIFIFTLIAAANPRIEFDKLDLDRDGVIQRSEASQKAAFDRIDRDHNGVVTIAEFDEYSTPLPPPSPFEKSVHEDVIYYDHKKLSTLNVKDKDLVSLDIYQPVQGKKMPVVAYVHGGGWRRGDKRAVGHKPDFFLASGFLFVSINYRLRPTVEIEILQQDVAAAVAWIYRNIQSFGGDPANIFLLGHSAGAHQVAIVGTRQDLLGAHGLDLSDIAGVVELDTMALDVPLMMETGTSYYGPIFGIESEKLIQVSPYHHIRPNQRTPAFMFVVADGNERKLMQSQRMAARLNSFNIHAEVIEAPNRTHGTLNQSLGGMGDVYGAQIVTFMKRNLR
ncbi:MAG: carboxylesterase family protein [Pseudomonadales bacterium]